MKSKFFIEVKDESGYALKILTAKNVTSTTLKPLDNQTYKDFVAEMYRTIPRMFVKKGHSLSFCCTNQSSGAITVFGYAKFDLKEVV